MLGFVIGDSNMVTGFRLVGVEGIEVASVDEAWRSLDNALARNDLAIIIISEDFSTQTRIQAEIDKVRRERRSPLIIELPGSRGKQSQFSMANLISKTLGVKL